MVLAYWPTCVCISCYLCLVYLFLSVLFSKSIWVTGWPVIRRKLQPQCPLPTFSPLSHLSSPVKRVILYSPKGRAGGRKVTVQWQYYSGKGEEGDWMEVHSKFSAQMLSQEGWGAANKELSFHREGVLWCFLAYGIYNERATDAPCCGHSLLVSRVPSPFQLHLCRMNICRKPVRIRAPCTLSLSAGLPGIWYGKNVFWVPSIIGRIGHCRCWRNVPWEGVDELGWNFFRRRERRVHKEQCLISLG